MGNELALIGTKTNLMEAMRTSQETIQRGLPSELKFDQVLNFAYTAVTNEPKLLQCTIESFLKAFIESVMLNLIPNCPLNHAALVPFAGKVKLMPMYEGLVDLAYRSGKISTIETFPVYPEDEFVWKAGHQPDHTPALESKQRVDKQMIYVYSLIRIAGAEAWPKVEVMTRIECDLIRARSAAASRGDSPWTSDYVMMCRKTVLKRNLKGLPKSIDKDYGLAKAIMYDNQFEAGKTQTIPDLEPVPTDRGDFDKMIKEVEFLEKDLQQRQKPTIEIDAFRMEHLGETDLQKVDTESLVEYHRGLRSSKGHSEGVTDVESDDSNSEPAE